MKKVWWCRHAAVALLPLVLAAAGCRSVHNVDRADSEELAGEGTIVFVRPTEYSLLGTKSLSDYIEIVYERAGQIHLSDPEQHAQVIEAHRAARDFWQDLVDRANAE